MSKIKIKNFGPIKEGYQENDGLMDVKKVTVFIGNQGSGKSTVAKLISILTWLEKAINRGDEKREIDKNTFLDFLAYQRIESYLKTDTVIEYIGERMTLKYSHNEGDLIIEFDTNTKYLMPKIMYVPAERNFLSVIKEANNVKNIPETLFTFAEEFQNGKNEFNDKEITLPISDINFKYIKENDASILIGKDYKVNLSDASSGYQSLVPLFIVTKYLTDELKKGRDTLRPLLSVTQSLRRSDEITKVLTNEKLSHEDKRKGVEIIDAKYLSVCFVNIVEEPEQNLFPSSQHQILNSLLEFNNMNEGNKLIITTHSPYLLIYLTLCVEADKLKKKAKTEGLKSKLNDIVPLVSTVDGNDLVVYQLDEKNGTIEKLKNYKSLPSDENKLNDGLAEANDEFSKLLDLEDLCQ